MVATSVPDVERLLQPPFVTRHVRSALKHFRAMNTGFQQGAWEQAIGKSGKFVEAALKALHLHVGKTLPAAAKDFKVDTVINELQHKVLPGSFDDTIRLTIPRACRFVYDVASNRGARHDPAEIDPNQMDARVVVAGSAWVLAEMLRYAQKGTLDPDAVRELVDGLTQRQYPLIEDVDGRVYFHVPGVSARDVAVLSLWRKYPARMTKEELTAAVMRHRFNKANAMKAVSRVAHLVDEDEHARLRLLQPGLRDAEQLISSTEQMTGPTEPISCVSGFPLNVSRLAASVNRPRLDDVASRLRQDPSSRVIIVGHSDSGELYPEIVARRRAEAAKDYLVKHIEESRITTRSAGATKPLDTRKDAIARAQNRRIELILGRS